MNPDRARGKAETRRRVEDGLGSAGRLRILRILASNESPSQTKYGLEKLTGLSPVYVRKHLNVLMKTGWVKELNYSPPVYTLDLDNLSVKALVDFFRKIGYL